MHLGLKNGIPYGQEGAGSDKLALDLQFAADKTLTARKGPTPTFSRASAATEIGSDGLIRYAPENLLLRSQEFNLTWAANNSMTVTADAVIAPDGTLTADAINFDSNTTSRIIQFAGSAVVHTFSVWLRADTNKTVVIATQASGSLQVETICNVTTTWQRFSVVATNWSSGTASFNVRIANNAAGTSGTVYAWGAQLERYSSARTYIPTTTATVYGARFDHDPVTLASRGLLIEEARTNLMPGSNNFTGYWVTGGGSLSSAANVAPDGAANSFLFSEDTATSAHRFFQSFTGVSGTTYTTSVFLKFAGRAQVFIETRSITSNPFAVFNIQSGTVVQVSSGITATMQQFPNGWWRCSITGTANAAGGNTLIGGFVSGSQSYTGSGSAAFYAFGAQVEAGSFPTSYIPTTTASVVRSADVCSITGSDFALVYNQAELSIYSEVSYPSASVGFPVVSFNNSTSAERVELSAFVSPLRLACFIVQNSVTQASPNLAAAANQFHKAAICAKLNSFQIALNGALGTKDTTGVMPTATRLNIGKQFNEVYLNGHLKRVSIYKKALSDIKLQSLTV